MVKNRLVEVSDVVEEVTVDSGVGRNGGGLEAEVLIVVDNFFVDVLFANRDGDRQTEGQAGAGGALDAEQGALEIVVGSGGDAGTVGRDEVDAGIVEVHRKIAIVSDDNVDGQHAVVGILQAKIRSGLLGGARLGGYGDVLILVGIVERILLRGRRLDRLACLIGTGWERESQKDCNDEAGTGHRVDYPLEGAPGAKTSVMMLLYSGLLTIALAGWTLRYLVPLLKTPGSREGLAERFGRGAEALAPAVAGRRVVWAQAVSVGEVLAASRLVAELEASLGDGWRVVVSTTTKTGQALAKERFGADRVFYMPLDFAFAVRAYMRVLKPVAVVLIESEVWPRMMHECRKAGTPVIVVNARVSDRSFGRSLKVRWLWSRVLRQATLWLAQSEEDARRLVAMGARADAVKVGGNLKYDVRAPKASRVAELIREAAAGRPIVVAGSTVGSTEKNIASEEAQVVQSWMKGALPLDALLVLAPRHPERFSEAWEIAYDFPALRATDLVAGKRKEDAVARAYPDGKSLETMDIVLLDTIGDLAAVYGLADIAYVGGSMFPRGGHNPLEPAQFGVPVVMGPSFENFRDIVAKMRAADAICIVQDEEQLESVMLEMLKDREAAKAMGERGRQVFEDQQGATARAVEAVVAMIQGAKS